MIENNNDTPVEETNSNPLATEDSTQQIDETMTIGRFIKIKREEKNLSLKVISQQTKIHLGLLENLEADKFDNLPSKTYVRGFIKSTSKILNMDQEVALQLLDNAYAKNASKAATPSPNKEITTETARNTLSTMSETPLNTFKSITTSSAFSLAKITIGIFFLGFILLNIKTYVQKSSEESVVKLPEVLTTIPKKVEPILKPDPKPVVIVPKVEEPIKINLIQDKNVKSDITINDIKLKTISIGERQYVEDTSITEEARKELLPAKYRVQPTKGTETVFINAADGESWLTYKVDDKAIKKFVLRQGRTLFLQGSVIRLFMGNTQSLKVFYNNKLINLNATNKSGVINLVIPDELKTKYLAPLFVFQEDGTVLTSDEFIKESQSQSKKAPVAEEPKTNSQVKTNHL